MIQIDKHKEIAGFEDFFLNFTILVSSFQTLSGNHLKTRDLASLSARFFFFGGGRSFKLIHRVTIILP